MATMVFVVRRLRAIECACYAGGSTRGWLRAVLTGGEISARVAEPTARRDWSKRRDRSRLWAKRTLFVFRPSQLRHPTYSSFTASSISSPHLARVPASSARTPPRPSPPARAARPPSPVPSTIPATRGSPQGPPDPPSQPGVPGFHRRRESRRRHPLGHELGVASVDGIVPVRRRAPPVPPRVASVPPRGGLLPPPSRRCSLAYRASTRARTSFGRLYLSS